MYARHLGTPRWLGGGGQMRGGRKEARLGGVSLSSLGSRACPRAMEDVGGHRRQSQGLVTQDGEACAVPRLWLAGRKLWWANAGETLLAGKEIARSRTRISGKKLKMEVFATFPLPPQILHNVKIIGQFSQYG